MKILKSFIFIVVSFLFLSCAGNEASVTEINLQGLALKVDTSNNTKPIKYIYGNHAISQGIYDESGYYGSAITDKELKSSESLFKIGNGHNEFGWVIFGKGIDGSFVLLDTNAGIRSLTMIPANDNISEFKNAENWVSYDLKNLPSFRYTGENFFALSDSTIMVVGAPMGEKMQHLISIIDFKNLKVTPLDYWPEDGIKVPDLVKHAVYADYGKVFGNGKGQYLYQCGRERYAFVFSIEGTKVNVIKDLYKVYSDYTTKDEMNYITLSRNPEELYCDTDADNIYILLKDSNKNGEKLEKWKDFNIFGNLVEVYDWSGNKKSVLRLDHYGQRIMLSNDKSKLYLLSDDFDSDQEIWVYDIKGL